MTNCNPLDEKIHIPVTPEARCEIIRHMWPVTSSTGTFKENQLNWNAYFDFYTRSCTAALIDRGQHLWARTHEDLLQIAHLLKSESTKEGVEGKIRQRITKPMTTEDEDKMVHGTIELATRLLVMVNAGRLRFEVTPQRPMLWGDESLFNAVHTQFNDCDNFHTEDTVLGSELTARYIDRIAKIKIRWTENLVDHLRLVDEDKQLCVFHHVSFLRQMEQVQRFALC
jgi:hypothetical protein